MIIIQLWQLGSASTDSASRITGRPWGEGWRTNSTMLDKEIDVNTRCDEGCRVGNHAIEVGFMGLSYNSGGSTGTRGFELHSLRSCHILPLGGEYNKTRHGGKDFTISRTNNLSIT